MNSIIGPINNTKKDNVSQIFLKKNEKIKENVNQACAY